MVRAGTGHGEQSRVGIADERRGEASSSSSFLTKAQQEILDAAVKEKQKTGSLSRSRSHGEEQGQKLSRPNSLDVKAKDRHSRSRSDKWGGKPKKGGAGGKFVWGASLEAEAANGAVDPNDPNYDSSEDAHHHVRLRTKQSVQASLYKAAVLTVIQEFFASGDTQDAVTSLQELEEPEFGHYFVKKLVAAALDKNDRAREQASSLLSSLYAVVLPPEQVEKGFLLLAEAVEDLEVDVPGATELVAHFIARGVIDDILPPAFLNKLPNEEGAPLSQLRHKAEAQLKAPHSAERILRCWGGQALVTFTSIQDSISKILQEYLVSADRGEAADCLRRIGLPLVHHELVKQALVMALTEPSRATLMLQLLAHLAGQGAISDDQLIKGFKRVADNLGDLELDVPGAMAAFERLLSAAEEQGWAPPREQIAPPQPPPTALAISNGVQAFKAAATTTLKEYFASGDAPEAGRCLLELQEPGLHSLVVKLAVQLAMEARDREREMTAVLLASISPQVLTEDQVALGFTRLLACAEDLSLDCPDAAHQLALMLGRLIVDEVLPPAFLTGVLPSLRDQSMGVSIVQTTGKLLSARHAAERLQMCWKAGCRTLEEVKAAIKELVEEYLVTGDAGEAARCWRELDVSFFGHQLIVTILLAAFDSPVRSSQLLRLIERLAASGELSQTQIQKGFQRVELQLSDLRLDYPSSPKQFDTCKAAALQKGWLGGTAEV